ncbi:hypothetical protein CEE36_10675 [candidate division TA06 bacterium B3_TA06]|uniref:Secretion system C-terminal sorting domain-containing protein n=1 Tax=candidate division TA06 bacterium B3_TA06 TaxID=2012487 RepID=A0A532UU60_UNCT6|nr:MAG: hypothetical protein CEE36_10675 [candidate division TA06 bacterium B3_TA06]
MKRLSLVLTLVTLLAESSVQATTWFKTYGGEGVDRGTCVQEVEDGYIVTGRKALNSDDYALWLLKTDTLGNVIWSKTYRATDSTDARGNFVRQTSDGGYIITGVDWSGFSQIWLLKTNADGDTLWTRNFGRSIGYCVQETNDGGYILAGRRNWNDAKLFLLKTNPNGDSVWMQTYLPNGWDVSIGFFVQQTRDTGYIVTGFVGDTMGSSYPLCLIKTDAEGKTQWTLIYNAEGGQCVRQTRDSNYLVAGIIRNHAGLLKVNSSGDTLWSRTYGFDQASCCIEKKEKDEYVLTGDAYKSMAFSNSKAGNSWLLSTDNYGDSLWARNYGSMSNYYVQETRDNGFIITGGSGDLFLLKTDSLGLLGVVENPIVESDNGWNVPHSIGSYIVLHYQGLPQGFRANVFDVSGRKVDQIRGDANEGAMTWGINQPPGVYFIQALDNRNQLKTAKVVLVR